jgi:hypothetical protein
VNENEPTGSVVSFTLSEDGVPTKVDELSSEGSDPPYVASFGDDGKEVLIVNVSLFVPLLPLYLLSYSSQLNPNSEYLDMSLILFLFYTV